LSPPLSATAKLSFAPLHKVYETWPDGNSPDYSVDLARMRKLAAEEALSNLEATLSFAYDSATAPDKSFLRQRLNEAKYRLNVLEALEDLAGMKKP